MGSLTIETSLGSVFTVGFSAFDTILHVKMKIEAEQGFPVANQTLTYMNQPVSDTDYVINPARLHLRLDVQLTIYFDDKIFPLSFPATDSVPNLKKTIAGGEPSLADPPPPPTDSIPNFKKIIAKDKPSLADLITINLHNGLELADTYRFTGSENYHLTVFFKKRLNIHIFGIEKRYDFKAKETVVKLKEAIARDSAQNLSVDQIKLFLSDTQEMSENDKALEAYGVSDGSVVKAVIAPIVINLMVKILGTDNTHHAISIDVNETVASLKDKISVMVNRPRDWIMIFKSDHELQDQKVLGAYGLKDGSTLLAAVPIMLRIKHGSKNGSSM